MIPSIPSTRSSKKRRRKSPRKPSPKHSNSTSKACLCSGCNVSFADNKSLLYHKKRSDNPKCQSDLIACDVCGALVLNDYGLGVHQRSDTDCINRRRAIEETSVLMRNTNGPLSNNQHINQHNNEVLEDPGLFDIYSQSDNRAKSSDCNPTNNSNNSTYSSSDDHDIFVFEQDSPPCPPPSHIPQSNMRHVDPSLFDLPPTKDSTVVNSEKAARRLNKVTRGLSNSLPKHFISAHLFYRECKKRNTMLRIDVDKIQSCPHISKLALAIVKVFRLTVFESSQCSAQIDMFIRQFYDKICDCQEAAQFCHAIKEIHVYAFLERHGIVVNSLDIQTGDSLNSTSDQQDEEDERLLENSLNIRERYGQVDIASANNGMNVVGSFVENKMLKWQKELKGVRENVIFDKSDIANIELFQLLRTSGAPKYLFERIQQWSARHSYAMSSSNPVKRQTFVKDIRTKTYGPNFSKELEPKIEYLYLLNGSRIPVVYFSFRAAVASLLSNNVLMKDDNLLLNPDNPFNSTPDGDVLSDLNSGWWYRETVSLFQLQCGRDILLPIILFIDGSTIDSNQKMNVEPITFTLGIFKRSVRNRHEAWRTIGYIEKLKHVVSESIVRKANNPKNRLQDKHTIIKFILKELIELQGPDAGFEWDLEIGGKVHRVHFKMAVQVIIGDCKGNDELCGRYGNHSRLTSGFCRDCKVDYDKSDNPYHLCQWITPSDFIGKTEEDLNQLGFHSIENAFSLLNFGAGGRGVYGATPSEPLHSYKLGICKYLFDGFVSDHLPKTTLKKIDKMVTALGTGTQRQSYQPVPKISVVRHGITKIGTLTADEQFARIFCVYLSLNNPMIFKSLSNDTRYARRTSQDDDIENLAPVPIGSMGIEDAKKWFHLFEDTVLYHSWLYAEEHDLDHLVPEFDDDSGSSFDNNNEINSNQQRHRNRSDKIYSGNDSDSMHFIRKYLADLKSVLNRSNGNKHRLVKFHQQLHNPRQVLKDGVLLNVDGGRCESIAIQSSKNQAAISQKRAVKLNWQIANNLFDDTSVKDASILKDDLNDFESNDLDCLSNENDLSPRGSHFSIWIDDPDTAMDDRGPVSIVMKWRGRRSRSQLNQKVSEALVKRLFFNTSVGGCLKHNSVIKGFTELKLEGHTYRSHPSYWGERPWYDWALVQWDHDSDPYPAQICMFLDLSEATFMNDVELDDFRNSPLGQRLMERSAHPQCQRQNNYEYLTRTMWMVVRSSLSQEEQGIRLRDEYRVASRICNRYYMEDEYRIIPVDSIEGPAFCLHVNGTVNCSNDVSGNNQIISVRDKKEWKSLFLNNGL